MTEFYPQGSTAVEAARYVKASNEAYLVSHGVRPMALCATVKAKDTGAILEVMRKVEQNRDGDAKPFILQIGERTHYGYYSEPWALNLFLWLEGHDGALPEEHSDAIYGMLHGYAPSSISQFLRDGPKC